MNYKQKAIKELTDKMKTEGLRVFLSESGTYGFFTDDAGERIVSFQYDLTFSFSGNYIANNPKNAGQGWQITTEVPHKFAPLLNVAYPSWAAPDGIIRYKTVEDYLKLYGPSSKYREI